MRCKTLVFLGLVVMLAVAAGCLFSPDNPKENPETPAVPFAGDPDQLMANFRAAYGGRDIASYREALGTPYEFILNPGDVAPGNSDRFTYAEEMQIAGNMFSGNAVGAVPGISRITIMTFERAGPWTDMGLDDPDFPGTQRGLYNVKIDFARADMGTIVVEGPQEFFVAHKDTTVAGVPKQLFRVVGQRDLTHSGYKRGNDSTSWSEVKSLYK